MAVQGYDAMAPASMTNGIEKARQVSLVFVKYLVFVANLQLAVSRVNRSVLELRTACPCHAYVTPGVTQCICLDLHNKS